MRNVCFGIAVLATLFAAPARADYIVSAEFLGPDGSGGQTWGKGLIFTAQDNPDKGATFLATDRFTPPVVQTGSGPVAVATYHAFVSNVADAGGGHVTDAPLLMRLRLTDLGSGQSGLLTFHGTFTGYAYQSDWLVDSAGSFTDPAQSLTLGANRYAVTIPAFGGESIQGKADLTANVVVTPVTAPEPSALLLAAAGASGLALARLRRRRGAALAG